MLATWVLILHLGTSYSGSTVVAEFSTEDKCRFAATEMISKMGKSNLTRESVFVCVPK
jgi:hypothetical protein